MHNSVFKNNKDSTCSYSIWILPDENLYVYLSSIIRKLSFKYGGPIFHPHITVIGGFQGDQKDLIKKTYKSRNRAAHASHKGLNKDFNKGRVNIICPLFL